MMRQLARYIAELYTRIRGPRGCNMCKKFRKGEETSFTAVSELEAAADKNCPMCSLLREALRCCIPAYESRKFRFEGIVTVFQLRWLPEGRPRVGSGINIDLFTLDGDSSIYYNGMKIPTMSYTSGDTSSTASWKWAIQQLHECTQFHNSCGRALKQPLPTRVLDVGASQSYDQGIKLYESENENDYYVCLSHCWGDSEVITTTTATLVQILLKITWNSLPKTFQDAVVIIDSLCIIQDDLEDWGKESAKMAKIYQNAYLTIAATKSRDDEGGCFSIPSPVYISQELSFPRHKSQTSRLFARRRIPHSQYWSEDVIANEHDFSLLSRGWIYQECLLSTRVLHLANNELLWECKEHYDCEGACQSRRNSLKNFHSDAFQEPSTLPSRWRTMVTEYYFLKLTFKKDKLPALSGLAKQMQEFVDRAQLGYHSFIGHGPDGQPGDYAIFADVISAQCIPAGPDPTGEISSGYLFLREQLSSMSLSYKDLTGERVISIAESQGHMNSLYLYLDVQLGKNSRHEMYCLKLARFLERMSSNCWTYYLVLIKSPAELATYERAGLLCCMDEKLVVLWEENSETETKTVKIV
ncbi:HET-domain-containing protein [Stipitochalara longipes BDJ]|nr:HET-domain-containing protein [Stipitochalara longipes BDJ]